MRLLSVFIVGMACGAMSTRQAVQGAVSLPSGLPGGRTSFELRESWPAIGQATNQWALELKKQPQ